MKRLFRWQVIRWILLGMLLILIAIQFVPVDRVNPPVEAEVPAPAQVRVILRRACYDCHSNETVWPWYSQVAPFSWLLARDVREGREELNFSTWNQYSIQQQVKKLRESWKEVSEGDMPPWYYLPVHRDAGLSAEDRTALHNWTLSTASALEGKSDQGVR
jgi:mono/diheme cytochrome c family protein